MYSSGQDLVIRLRLKIPVMFVNLILQDGFRVVNTPIIRVVIFLFFALFPVDRLSHPIMSNLIIFLR